MRVSSKSQYGLLALAELADNYKLRRAVQVKEIAKNRDIPPEYLGQIMVLLNRGRLVHGSRGPTGGYILARPPETITLKEVLQVLEGPLVGIDLRPTSRGKNFSAVTQRLIESWARGVKALENVLDETTLADLCKPETPVLMYYI